MQQELSFISNVRGSLGSDWLDWTNWKPRLGPLFAWRSSRVSVRGLFTYMSEATLVMVTYIPLHLTELKLEVTLLLSCCHVLLYWLSNFPLRGQRHPRKEDKKTPSLICWEHSELIYRNIFRFRMSKLSSFEPTFQKFIDTKYGNSSEWWSLRSSTHFNTY